MKSKDKVTSEPMFIDAAEAQATDEIPPSPELVAFLELIGRALAKLWIEKNSTAIDLGSHENTKPAS